MPARCASKFCAQRRAAWPTIFFLSLTSYVIPGKLEPWPECQLELIWDLQPTTDLIWIYVFYSTQPTSQTHSIIKYVLLVEVWKMRAVCGDVECLLGV